MNAYFVIEIQFRCLLSVAPFVLSGLGRGYICVSKHMFQGLNSSTVYSPVTFKHKQCFGVFHLKNFDRHWESCVLKRKSYHAPTLFLPVNGYVMQSDIYHVV